MDPADHGDADLSVIGAVLADRSRCKILLALADGRALPAGRLAGEARVSAATASSYLHKLCAAGLLQVFRTGRYRYYRLAGDEVGQLLDALTAASWVRAADRSRALITTAAGKRGLHEHLGVSWPPRVNAHQSALPHPPR